jgi:hypothetical protein
MWRSEWRNHSHVDGAGGSTAASRIACCGQTPKADLPKLQTKKIKLVVLRNYLAERVGFLGLNWGTGKDMYLTTGHRTTIRRIMYIMRNIIYDRAL